MNTLKACLACALLIFSAITTADDTSPVGRWQTIDDDTGKPKSIVVIMEHGGMLSASVEKVLDRENGGEGLLCDKCKGDKKNQPMIGLEIMSDLRPNGEIWDGGWILDPKKGKQYKCKLTLFDGGQALDVRGYIGFSLIGRSQTWRRIN